VGTGYITGEQAALQFFQKGVTAAFSIGFDGLMNGFEIPGTENFLGGFEGIGGFMGENPLAMGLESMFSGMVQGNFNSWVNAFELDGNGGWDWNGEAYTEGAWGKNAWAGYVGSFIGSATTAAINQAMPQVNLQGYERNTEGLGIERIGMFSSTIGGLVGELAGSLIDGEFRVNLLNVSDFARWLGADESLAQSMNQGLLEVGIGFNDRGEFGVRSRIGGGGAALNLSVMTGLAEAFENVAMVNQEIQDRVDAAKARGRELRELREADLGRENPDEGLPYLSPENPEEQVTLPEPDLLPEIDYEREGKKDDLEEIMQGIDENSSQNEMQDAIHAAEEYLNEDGQIDSAEEFMADMVLEEGLQAFDFSALMEEMIKSGEWNADKTLEIEDHLEDIEDLKVRFEQALVLALSDSQEQLQSRLAFGDPTFFAYTSKLNELQDLGILNEYPSILRAVDTQFPYFLLGNNPWQEVFPIGFRAIGFQLQQKQFHIPEGIHPVRFGCFKEGVDHAGGFCTFWATRKQPVFSADDKGPDRVLSSVGVRCQISTVQISQYFRPLVQSIGNRLSGWSGRWNCCPFLF
jgi:hypothetical protein